MHSLRDASGGFHVLVGGREQQSDYWQRKAS